jgi:hypothetical protein
MPQNHPLGQSELFLVRSRHAARTATLYRCATWLLLFLIFVIVIAGSVWAVNAAGSKQRTIHIKYAWVQMLPDEPQHGGGRLARAIVTEGDRCPKVLEDSRYVDMDRRPSPLQAAFPVLICEAKIEAASDAWIGSRHLPKRPENPQDIVVIGDTGCRMTYWETQPCRSGVEWPFAAVAVSAASRIQVREAQSIIVHVGDFHYRENPCADRNPDCGGSPYGDNWATWEKEFFEPASPLLLAAPWVIMRGNHENCDRAGAGWIFFFDLPGPTRVPACEHNLASYSLTIGQAEQRRRVLVVLDTANANNEYEIKKSCEAYRQWIGGIDDSDAIVWLALHQPLLSRRPDGRRNDTDRDDNNCEQGKPIDALRAVRALLLSPNPSARVKLLLSGDLHVFQYFQPTDRDKPVQIVAGMGGTKLDNVKKLLPKSAADKNAKRDDVGDEPQWDPDVTSFGVDGGALTIAKYGFVTMHYDGTAWTVAMLDVTGRTQASCRFWERSVPNPPATSIPDCKGSPKPEAMAPPKP